MSEEVDVIILGAGLTGLTVARGLKLESSLSFLVLEARDRLGGRVHSVQAEGGPVVEMGATWFFPSFRNLFKLLRELKVELGEQYMKGHIMYETSREAAPSKNFSTGDEEDLFRIKGGTAELVRRLTESVGMERVRLSCPATSVQVHQNVTTVTTSGGREWRCRLLVSTLPPRLLVHSVSFWPALKEEEAAVMRQTHTWMGDTVKAALTYSSPFWRERELAGALHSQCGPCTQLYDQTSHHHSHHHGALAGFVSPELSRLSAAQREAEIKAQLVKIFGPEAEDNLQYWDTVWGKEKFTVWPGEDTEKILSHNNHGHRLYQAPLLGGRLIVGGTETATRGAGLMEGAVNSAATVISLINSVLAK